jgi:hypothetical protein
MAQGHGHWIYRDTKDRREWRLQDVGIGICGDMKRQTGMTYDSRGQFLKSWTSIVSSQKYRSAADMCQLQDSVTKGFSMRGR